MTRQRTDTRKQLEIAIKALRKIAGEEPASALQVVTMPCCQHFDDTANEALREIELLSQGGNAQLSLGDVE